MRYDLKSFVELECDIMDLLASKTLNYIKKTIGLSERKIAWVFLDTKEILKEIPEYMYYFKQHKLVPNGSACTILHNNLGLHIDTLPVVAKMNFPIHNTVGWANRWYTATDKLLESLPFKKDSLGFDNVDTTGLKMEELELLSEHKNFKKPILLNSQQLHSVEKLDKGVAPRVMMTFTFLNDPWEMLQ